MKRDRTIGLEPRDGFDVGRDPQSMSADELERLGHARVSPLRALRLKCLDCCNGSAQEVRLCRAVDCPGWPFRMGSSPWRRKLDQGERAALLARLAPNDASEPTTARKTGGEIDTSPSDGERVPGDAPAKSSLTERGDDAGSVA